MKNNASFIYAVFLILGDFLALVAAFTVAYVLRVKLDPRPLIEQVPALTYLRASLAVLPLWIFVHAFIGLYNADTYERRFKELGRLLVGSFLGILVVIGYDFVSNTSFFPARLVPVYGLGLGFGFLVLFRAIARIIRELLFFVGIGISNVLIVGDTETSEHFANSIRNTKRTGQRVLGIVTTKKSAFHTYASFQEALERIKHPIHSIIQTELYTNSVRNNEMLRYAQQNHIAYRFVPGNSDLFVGNIDVELFAGRPVVAVHQTALIGWGRIVKRLFDLIFTSIAMVVALPLMALIAILVAIFDHHGPIFFKQTRLTRFNSEFKVYKFRTLKTKYSGISPEEAFELMGKPQLSKKYRENGDFLANDPRISAIGKFLRLTSLDELPQLFNVLLGELSLVGPRALVPEELEAFEKRHAILSVKSGLTGLAQISGRRDLSFEERRKLDIYYVQNWSFWLDIIILLRTVRAVLAGEGAK
jgi:exopolysaccharide biosynthesis polyprenyl glycosylphosphotransferase